MDQNTLELLLTEILGTSPQVILDDYTNVAHENVRNITDSLEQGVHAWLDAESASISPVQRKAYLDELERGTVALQTLIDSHADFSFDLFEAWTWRNIFSVPPEAAERIVMPHHKGLDLTISEREETEARDELAGLRRKLEAMTRIDELLADGVKASRRRKARAEQMLRELEFLESTDEIRALPDTIIPLFDTLRQVPKTSDFIISTQSSPSTSQPNASSSSTSPAKNTTENGKRPWETSHDAFLAWGASKAIQASRKPSEAARSKLLRGAGAGVAKGKDSGVDAMRAAEWLRGLEDAAEKSGDGQSHANGSANAGASADADTDAVMEDGERASNSQGST